MWYAYLMFGVVVALIFAVMMIVREYPSEATKNKLWKEKNQELYRKHYDLSQSYFDEAQKYYNEKDFATYDSLVKKYSEESRLYNHHVELSEQPFKTTN